MNNLVQRPKNMKNKKGFTLIELIVVIVIIGILAAIIVPRLSGFQDTAKKKADLATGKTIGTAVATLVADQKITYSSAKAFALTSATVAGTGSDAAYVRSYVQSVPANKNGTFWWITVTTTGDVSVFASSTAATAADQVFPTSGANYL